MEKELHILILEGNEAAAERALRELRRAHLPFNARRVVCEADFIRALTEFQPDVVLADYSLAPFGGLAALRVVTAQLPSIPFIIIAHAQNEETAVECMKAGVDDYVTRENLGRLGPAVRDARRKKEAQIAIEVQRAEETRRQCDARYRELFENAYDIIYTMDLDGNLTSINKAGERISGYTRAEVLSLKIGQLLESPLTEDAHRTPDRQVMQPMPSTYTRILIAKDRRRIPIEVTTRPIFQDARVVGIQGIARDVTERTHLEAQLRQSQKLEAIGTLAGGVAHDFNNILTGIIGFAELGLATISGDNPIHRNLTEIHRLGVRAAHLTRQLLAFARKQVLDFHYLDLNSVIYESGTFLRRIIGDPIKFRFTQAANLPVVYADPSQLEQVLLNLCINARDAMPDGGALSIETQDVRFDAAFVQTHPWANPGHYAMLSVRDTGAGIAPEVMARIFEPFFTTKEPGQGTGLGLSMAYGIIQQHGGFIHVISEVGHGTVFQIYLPAASDGRPAAMAPQGGNETILVAGSAASVREFVAPWLQAQGYEVLRAANRDDALRLFDAQADRISLVATDGVVGKAGGWELYDLLSSRKPHLKFLFIGDYRMNASSREYFVREGLDFLSEPFDPSELVARVRALLGNEERAASTSSP